MRVLSFDSGAKRAGWAVLDPGPEYISSGVEECIRRPKQTYQGYRMELTEHWVEFTAHLLDEYKPTHVVTEIVPPYGMNDFSQGYLANVMATTVHAITFGYGKEPFQVSAKRVQEQIAIRGKSTKITKPQVRNGVVSLIPELKSRAGGWTKIWEEPDAIAIGLHFLGYTST